MSEVARTEGRRSYSSALREERAANTRARILSAARELFAHRGFTSTTVPDIARDAGVAVPTVYATFGSKSGIVAALVAQIETEVSVEDWRARTEQEPDPRQKLRLYAAFHRELFSSGRDIWAAALNAATDPSAVDLQSLGAAKAKSWLTTIVAALARSGELAPGLTKPKAVDRGWILSAMELYFRVTDGLGWSDSEYEQWFASILLHELTGGDGGRF